MFPGEEADNLVAGWEILNKEKHTRYFRDAAAQTSLEEWMRLLPEAGGNYSEEDWREKYQGRTGAYRYSHLYYVLKKAET